jgi:hypothetical protein
MLEVARSEINSKLCVNVVSECVEHLFGLIKPNGKFVYAHEFGDKSREFNGYNLLRHCGTVWFMCKAINRLSMPLPPERQHALAKSVQYIIDKLRPPLWDSGGPPTLCLPSRVAVKTGGGGLCLLMLQEFDQLLCDRRNCFNEPSPIASLDAICERLENYLLSEIANGDFVHKRVFATGEILPFRSDYYTGEVLFALIKRGRFSERVAELFSTLIDRDYGVAEQSHWMAYAASEAARQEWPQKHKALEYLDRLIARIISEPDYRERRQSTPTACRTEALFAYLEIFKGENPSIAGSRRELLDQSYKSALENLGLQFAHYGDGQFKRGADSNKVQIDCIQHNAASFLGLLLTEPDRHLSAEQPFRSWQQSGRHMRSPF